MAYRNAACVSKSVTRPNYKIFKGVVRVYFRTEQALLNTTSGLVPGYNIKINCYKMAGYLLSSLCEAILAVVA